MRRSIAGATLYQYAIVLSLIALAVVPAFFLLGQNINLNLSGFSNMMGGNIESIRLNKIDFNLVSEGTAKAGELGGTSDNPVRICSGGNCSIDFGGNNFILNNIPENYGEIVETSGTAGTEVILNLAQDVAQQLEETETMTEEQLQQLKSLISRGEDIARIEEILEQEQAKYKDELDTLYNARKELVEQYQNGQISTQQFIDQSDSLYSSHDDMLHNLFGDTYNLELSTGQTVDVKYWQANRMLRGNTAMGIDENGEFSGTTYLGQNVTFQGLLDGTDEHSVMQHIEDGDNKILSPVASYLDEASSFLNSLDSNSPEYQMSKMLLEEIYTISDNMNEKSGDFSNMLSSVADEYYLFNDIYKPLQTGDYSNYYGHYGPPPPASANMPLDPASSYLDPSSPNYDPYYAEHYNALVNYDPYLEDAKEANINPGIIFDPFIYGPMPLDILVHSSSIYTGFDNYSGGYADYFANMKENFDQSASNTTRLDLSIICNVNRGEYNKDNAQCKGG